MAYFVHKKATDKYTDPGLLPPSLLLAFGMAEWRLDVLTVQRSFTVGLSRGF